MREKPKRRSMANQIVLNRQDLSKLGIRVSNSSLLRWEHSGRFPRRIRMAGTSVAWIKSEIDAWLEQRASERAGWHYADPY